MNLEVFPPRSIFSTLRAIFVFYNLMIFISFLSPSSKKTYLATLKTRRSGQSLQKSVTILQIYSFFCETIWGKLWHQTEKNKSLSNFSTRLTLSWRRPLSYWNQFIDLLCKSMYWFDLLCKSMDWFLYGNGPLHERVKAGVLVSNKRGRDIRLNIVLKDINKISTRYI